MKKLIFLLLALGSLQSFGQVSKPEVNALIDAKLTNSVRPSDIKAVAKKLSDFANQGDSTAKTKESFIVPGSSGAYLNGLKQWIPFPDLSIYSQNGHTHAWSVITGKPTTVATSGITDAVSLTGAQALSNKTGNISQWTNNAGYLTGITSGLVTGALGYTPVNGASTPSLVPVSNDVQSLGGTLNYFANGYIRQLNFNSSASMNGATNGKISFTGVLKGDGAELTNIPYSILTGKPTIPTNADYVDRDTDQLVFGEKLFASHGRFAGSYKSALTIGTGSNGGWINFANGTNNANTTGIGYSSATSTEFKIQNDESGILIRSVDGQSRFHETGGLTIGSVVDANYKLDVYGASNFRGNVSVASGSNISGDGSGLSNIPYGTAITGKPTIPTNADYVDLVNSQGVSGSKTFNNTANFMNAWIGYQSIFGAASNNAARVGFRDGAGVISGVIGYGSATSAGEFQFRAGSQSAFVNAGNSSLTMFSDGNILAQTGGTAVNAGYKLDIQGISRLNGTATTQLLIPAANVTYDIGSSSARYANVWTGQLVTPGTLSLGSTAVSNAITFRQGSATQISGGFHASGKYFLQNSVAMPTDNGSGLQVSHDITATAGKAWGQTFTPILRAAANNDELIGTVIAPALIPGSFTGVTSYALRVGAAMKMDGQIDQGGHIIPQADNLYNLGSSARRFGSVYGASIFSGIFLNPGGNAAFGASNTTSAIDFRQGTASQLVAGFHPSGNMWIQPRGPRPADDGYNVQIGGHVRVGGELFNEPVPGAGFRTSDLLSSPQGVGFHGNDGGVASISNLFLGYSAYDGKTYLNAGSNISLTIGLTPKVFVTPNRTEFGTAIKLGVVPEFADNAAAIAGGKFIGDVYRTGDLLKIVH